MFHDPVAALVTRLDSGGFDPRPTGAGSWESRCPAHGGRRHNLSIKRGGFGRVLIHCHHEPGCKPADIMAALDMKFADLFAREPGRATPSGNGEADTGPKPRRRAYPT